MVSWKGSGPFLTVQPGRSAVRRLSTWFSKSWAFIVVCWPIADVTGSRSQACRPRWVPSMRLSRWFRGGAPTGRDRGGKGLQQARDGDADGAIETIAERFSDALAELRALPEKVDTGWLRLPARLGHRAGDMPAAPGFGAPGRSERG